MSQSTSQLKILIWLLLLVAAGVVLAISCFTTFTGPLAVAKTTPPAKLAAAVIAERVRKEKDVWGWHFSFENYTVAFGDQIVIARDGKNGFNPSQALQLKRLLDNLYVWALQYDPELISIIAKSKTYIILSYPDYHLPNGGSAGPTMFSDTRANIIRGIIFAQVVFDYPNIKGGNDGKIMEIFIHEVSRNYASERDHCSPGYYSDIDDVATEEMLSARIQPSMSPSDQEGMKSGLEWAKKNIDPTRKCK